jgi:hypothetical protein
LETLDAGPEDSIAARAAQLQETFCISLPSGSSDQGAHDTKAAAAAAADMSNHHDVSREQVGVAITREEFQRFRGQQSTTIGQLQQAAAAGAAGSGGTAAALFIVEDKQPVPAQLLMPQQQQQQQQGACAVPSYFTAAVGLGLQPSTSSKGNGNWLTAAEGTATRTAADDSGPQQQLAAGRMMESPMDEDEAAEYQELYGAAAAAAAAAADSTHLEAARAQPPSSSFTAGPAAGRAAPPSAAYRPRKQQLLSSTAVAALAMQGQNGSSTDDDDDDEDDDGQLRVMSAAAPPHQHVATVAEPPMDGGLSLQQPMLLDHFQGTQQKKQLQQQGQQERQLQQEARQQEGCKQPDSQGVACMNSVNRSGSGGITSPPSQLEPAIQQQQQQQQQQQWPTVVLTSAAARPLQAAPTTPTVPSVDATTRVVGPAGAALKVNRRVRKGPTHAASTGVNQAAGQQEQAADGKPGSVLDGDDWAMRLIVGPATMAVGEKTTAARQPATVVQLQRDKGKGRQASSAAARHGRRSLHADGDASQDLSNDASASNVQDPVLKMLLGNL